MSGPEPTPLDRELPSGIDPGAVLRLDPDSDPGWRVGGPFAAVVCRDTIRACPNPMALLTDLWRRTEAGAPLLLETEVLPIGEDSTCARFLPGRGGWVPGRLALRWMVEVAGFEVVEWLDDPDDSERPRAALRALRSDREPARSEP